SGERMFEAPRATVWRVLNDPASMAKVMPGVEGFDVHDSGRWTANVKIPLGLGGLRMKVDMEKTEEREPEFAKMTIKGTGVGVMQLTMEPLDEMLASARAMDDAGMDTIWLAEAYPWWRKHGMEARSSTGVAALMGRETKRLTIGWGIIAASTRHPVQAAMDARVVQEVAGPGRFILGFGTSKIFLNNTKTQTKKTLGPMRDAVTIARGVLSGDRFDYDGDTWSADVPALAADAHAPREVPPVYVAATAPKMQQLAGEIADGCLTPSITTPGFVRYTRQN